MTDTADDMPTYTTSRRSADLDKLFTALAKAQGSMQNAERVGENPAFKRDGKASTYATLASVIDAVRKPLADNGLSLSQWPRTNGNGVEVETVLSHASGQYMRDTLWLPCPQMTAHAVGSMISYLRRYSAMACLGIAPSDDDDGNAATEAHKPSVPGSAGGGTDFRPATRRLVNNTIGAFGGHSSANGRRMANDDAHLVDETRKKGTTSTPPTTADRAEKIATRAKEYVDRAVNTLKLSGQTTDSIKRFLADNHSEIQFLEAQAPAQHDRLFETVNAALEAANARVPF
jgi:hypothetical protein